jgi:hypothetical protein
MRSFQCAGEITATKNGLGNGCWMHSLPWTNHLIVFNPDKLHNRGIAPRYAIPGATSLLVDPPGRSRGAGKARGDGSHRTDS